MIINNNKEDMMVFIIIKTITTMMIRYDNINNNGYGNGNEINYTNTSTDDY